MPKSLPRVAILGRPNVGKSTLFNRICGRRRALVGDEPGMTRDRIYAPAEWLGKEFEVIDTGGMIPDSRDLMAAEIFRHAKTAIEEADCLVLVVDGRQGRLPLDEELARVLHRIGKPLALAVNKIDAAGLEPQADDFRRLGIEHLFAVSAEHGRGVDELLNYVTADFTPACRAAPAEASEGAGQKPAAPPEVIQVAIIGRPNTGKSTLLNRLLSRERSIVTPFPGTTRDAVDAELERHGRRYRIIDTAGIRRKGKTKLLAEKLSVIQARKHLERADVALLVLDAGEGVTALDTHIGGYAHESRRSVVLVVNKWDLGPKGPGAIRNATRAIRARMKYLGYAPIVFVSALRGQGLAKLLGTAAEVAAARAKRVSDEELTQFLREVDFERATAPAGRPARIRRLVQVASSPPTFLASTERRGKLHFAFQRFLENRLRERFGFLGTPVVIKARGFK